jgi:Rod binding domain-containing protein
LNVAQNQPDQLDRLARVLVAQTFFGPMLKQMRNSPFKSDLLEGGRGGQVFQAQLDQKLAERMAGAGSGNRLVKSIVKRLEKNLRSHVPTLDRA